MIKSGGKAGLFDGRDCVPPSDDFESGELGDSFCESKGALGVLRLLEPTQRTVPEDRSSSGEKFGEFRNRLGSDIKAIMRISRNENRDIALLRIPKHGARRLDIRWLGLLGARGNRIALNRPEGMGHGASNRYAIHASQKRVDRLDLVRHFRSAEHGVK